MSNPNTPDEEPEDELFPYEADRLAIDDVPEEDESIGRREVMQVQREGSDRADPEPTHGTPFTATPLSDMGERSDEPSGENTEENTDGGVVAAVGGFFDGGITNNETITLVGTTIASYTLAWGMLTVMADHGIHHAPVVMWALLVVLVTVPLTLLFGTGIAEGLIDTATGAGGSSSGGAHDAEDADRYR